MSKEYKAEQKIIIPETSQIEDDAKKMFSEQRIQTEDDLEREITRVFSEICGKHGKQEFFESTLPAIKQIYGTNYRKAGLRLLEIIDKGAEHRPEKIGEYFETVVSKEEFEYSKKPKDEIVEDIVKNINEIILEKKKEGGGEHKGIVAVVIYGSFAKKNFSLNSDLDIICFSDSSQEEDEQRGFHFGKDFEYSLGRKIRPPIQNLFGTFYLPNHDNSGELNDERNSFEKNTYIVVSPYPEIKERIELLLTPLEKK
ncbi:MAG: hypothetical protein G01um101444_58 [Parcubacteria group bacterium Gr01-1014_44]|nr:MAG: hypothetical protein G01um101444_58 [Parcubacteria group bacterium Gr01-1014_44]